MFIFVRENKDCVVIAVMERTTAVIIAGSFFDSIYFSISSGFMFPSPSVLIPPSPTAQPVPCKFYPSCTKSDCPFYHPQPKVGLGIQLRVTKW